MRTKKIFECCLHIHLIQLVYLYFVRFSWFKFCAPFVSEMFQKDDGNRFSEVELSPFFLIVRSQQDCIPFSFLGVDLIIKNIDKIHSLEINFITRSITRNDYGFAILLY